MYWNEVGKVSGVNMSLSDFNITEDLNSSLRFALSAEAEDAVSSGMSWDKCGQPRLYSTNHIAPTINTDTSDVFVFL